ncbi:MAG TPA: anti-sigma regulatory factor [Gemmatimonadales bacterium]|nr:anti-sigma regulatory factor [Gemmatimonadales bacterium]
MATELRTRGATVPDSRRLVIATDKDVVSARQIGRELAAEFGFSPGDQTVIAAAISEIARNILMYARRGEVSFQLISDGARAGITVTAQDEGPGIPDVARALLDGYSTSGGLGLGLPGAKRLMDEFDIVTDVGRGTTITMSKLKRPQR